MKNIVKKYKANWHYFKGYKHLFYMNILIKFISIGVLLITPLVYARIITYLIERELQFLLIALAVMVGLKIFSIMLSQITARLEIKIIRGVNIKIKQKLFRSYVALPPYKLKNISDGKIYNLITGDSNSVTAFIFAVTNCLFNIITVIGIGAVIFFLSWQLAIIILATFPATYFVNKYFAKKFKKQTIEIQKHSDGFVGFFKNIVANVNDLKAIRANEKASDLFGKKATTLNEKGLEKDKTQITSSLIGSFIEIANYVLIMVSAAFLVVAERLSLGNFIAFNNYSSNFTSSLSAVINLNASLQPNIASLERLEEFNKIYTEFALNERSKEGIDTLTGAIDFENISLTLSNKQILSEFNLVAKSKKLSGIIGQNGSGKTTLLNLLTNIYVPDVGSIKIDGIELSEIPYEDLQNNIAYIRQNPVLFHMTLLDNLLLFDGSDKISAKQIDEVCKAVNLLEDIQRMPNGFETEFNDKMKLSVGQTQKVQIARALLMNRPIILIDEATVNLDIDSRQKVYEIIKKLSLSKTVIFISNNESEMIICDEVYKIS